tara:strand:+ start:1601 stop:1894 length:294 start_codon:yes stop_codon:yes gene_type:complete
LTVKSSSVFYKQTTQKSVQLAAQFMRALNFNRQEACSMRKIVEFSKRKYMGFGSVDLDALNNQLDDIAKEGWVVVSMNSNTWFSGFVVSYTLLIERK